MADDPALTRLPAEAAEAADPRTPPERLTALANRLTCNALVAANPSTPVATLERLRAARDPAVRAAVAGNPNTPLPVLRQLVAEFPQEFLENPALPFLLLENPNLGADFTLDEVGGLMRCECAPRALLHPLLASRDPGIRELVPLHVSLAQQTRESTDLAVPNFVHIAAGLADASEPELYMLPGLLQAWFLELMSELLDAAQHRRGAGPRSRLSSAAAHGASHEEMIWCPDAAPMLLARLATNLRPEVRVRVAAHPNTPLPALEQLAADPIADVRRAAAECMRLPLRALRLLLADSDHTVRRAAAWSPCLPRELLARLAESDDPAIRMAVGRHAQTGAATLWRLADDWDSGVRGAVARNPTAPAHVLRHLVSDDDPGVRAGLAQNRRVPAGVLALLTRDEEADVLDAVCRHPGLAVADRDRLAADPARHVALAANPKLPLALIAAFARANSVEVVRVLASHPRAPVVLLDQLSRSADPQVRRAVAGNPRTPVAALRQLAGDVNAELHLNLERNPSTPYIVLRRLVRTASARQMLAIARHPKVSPERRESLYRGWFMRQLRYRTGLSLPRLIALASTFLTPKTYEKASTSRFWIERYLLARNPAAPAGVHEALAHDGVIHVRAAARATLAARHERGSQPASDCDRDGAST